jgi:peptidoglycan/xylan/chitin deacetylase (PgdA/CDA1 family)
MFAPMTLRNRLKRILLAPVAHFSGPRKCGRVALTFDDGPNPDHTSSVAEALRRFSVQATFFLVGENAKKHPQLVEMLRQDGHELGNHSMTHAEVAELPSAALDAEFTAVHAFRHADGARVFSERWLRPPMGAVTFPLVLYCWRRGVKMVFWSTDPQDFSARSEDDILRYFSAHPIQSGDIVLMHDCTPHHAAALMKIIADLKARGLAPVTLSELLASRRRNG